MSELKIEGYTTKELENLVETNDFETLIFSNTPVVINAGSAEILAQFHKENNELHIDLAHIDGGGEGVLISINSLARKYAIKKNYIAINWYVNATNCANPNPKLQRILKLKNYKVKSFKSKGSVFYKKDELRT
ncbi:hypothetical protein [Winogradskyella sp.]|uniref:hypothetical protein n=1 Tax=Winogradskyella sp. TaxID=1883156 RepID=UPI003511CAF7